MAEATERHFRLLRRQNARLLWKFERVSGCLFGLSFQESEGRESLVP